MMKFLQNNAIDLIIVTFIVVVCLLIKSIQNQKKNDKGREYFNYGAVLFVLSAPMYVFSCLLNFFLGAWLVFTINYAIWLFITGMGLMCFFRGKYEQKKQEDYL